ncbi:hypothetical protein GTZ99_04190 [Novosphingobium sp. FSY-8]|uniref:Ricin-type beta-trefoil lectin protein n=1 Tax=Novosphingobium ovatum TaxID=1908523 RepID=A0ABW9XB64_9SPHN|nr:hypothetical protein [Novosphingobium ovatum]NBC35754.1 hypothetical protein [Novosphingobium ovatum]
MRSVIGALGAVLALAMVGPVVAMPRDHLPEDDVFYRFATAFQGERMHLDIINGGPDNNRAVLARAGNYSGQMWVVHPAEDGRGYRLTTQFRGGTMCLTAMPRDGRAMLMRCGPMPGQVWDLRQDRQRPQYLRLMNRDMGRGMCLDVEPRQLFTVVRPCAQYSGQLWISMRTDTPVRY